MNSDFISVKNARLRQVLRSDLAELEVALEHELHKASLVLAGGIAEAILTDYLEGIHYEGLPKGTDPAAMTLGNLIAACEKEGALTPQTVSQCHVLKQYRNVVHPGRSARYGESADADGAELAAELVEKVAAEVEKRALQRPEWAAESVYQRAMPRDDFIDDRPAYLRRMVRALPTPEAERLILEVLPARFGESLALPKVYFLLINCEQLVPLVLAEVSTSVASESARRLLRKMDELESDETADYGDYNVWLYPFFRPSLLADLEQCERDELLFYVVDDLEEGLFCGPAANMCPDLAGIGAYLSSSNATRLVSSLTELITCDPASGDPLWRSVLIDEMAVLPPEAVDAARGAMDAVVGCADSPEKAAHLSALRYEIWPLQDDEIPR